MDDHSTPEATFIRHWHRLQTAGGVVLIGSAGPFGDDTARAIADSLAAITPSDSTAPVTAEDARSVTRDVEQLAAENERLRAKVTEARTKLDRVIQGRTQAQLDRNAQRQRAEQAEAERDAIEAKLTRHVAAVWTVSGEEPETVLAERDALKAAIERVRVAVFIHPYAEDTSGLHVGYRICSERVLTALDIPESNANAPSPVTAATEAHGETTEAQEG